MNEQIEDLRFDRDDLASVAQLVTRNINFIVRETECRAILTCEAASSESSTPKYRIGSPPDVPM